MKNIAKRSRMVVKKIKVAKQLRKAKSSRMVVYVQLIIFWS